ncbi:MAG: hypothetical protein R3313_00665 [Candidatus Saccharimonadales bacterium]|nr:hypothetical protein [Candidatus Saccharimonadales bacterium]
MAKKKLSSKSSSAKKPKNSKKGSSSDSLWEHTRKFLKNLNTKQKLLAAIAIVLLAVGTLILTNKSLRLFALNLFSDANIVVVVTDSVSNSPIIGADVFVDSLTGRTDENGRAKIYNLAYGTHDIRLSKEAYESQSGTIEVERNEQEFSYNLTPNGIEIKIKGADFVTGDDVAGFKVIDNNNELSSTADEQGLARINVPPGTEQIDLTITAEGYNQAFAKYKLVDDDGNILPTLELEEIRSIQLVMTGRHHFLSNREGTLALWGSNYDGSDATAVVEDLTGLQELKYSPNGQITAFVVPLKGEENNHGTPKYELYFVDLSSGELNLIDEGDDARFRILNIDNDRLVYSVDIDNDEKTKRGKIKTYTFGDRLLQVRFEVNEIETAFYLNNHVFVNQNITRRRVCSTCRDGYRSAVIGRAFTVINLENDSVKDLEDARQAYARLHPQNENEIFYWYIDDKDQTVWKNYNLDTRTKVRLDGRPSEIDDQYVLGNPSPDGQTLIWNEYRDGTGTLIKASSNNIEKSEIVDLVGLSFEGLVYWLNDDYVIINASEQFQIGHYIVHMPSGSYQLIAKVYSLDYPY